MATFLPLFSLALVVALFLLIKGDPPEAKERGMGAAFAWIAGFSMLLYLGSYAWQGWNSDAMHASLGFVLGSLGASAWRFLPKSVRPGGAWGLAAANSGFIHWMPLDWRIQAQIGVIVGAAITLWLLQVRSPSSDGSIAFSLAVAATVGADLLGVKAGAEGLASTGSVLACAIASSILISSIVQPRNESAKQVIAISVLGFTAFAVGQRYLATQMVWMLFVSGMILGVVSNWLLGEEGDDAMRPLISAVLWVGMATLGFALRRGLGMSLGLLGGASVLIILRNPRALLTLGPLVGLVMYRVFREEHASATRALDIGQHYALVGLMVGAMLPLGAVEWLRTRWSYSGPKLPLSAVLWVFVLALAPIAVSVIMGPKGVVGFVVGLGLAGWIESLRPRVNPQALNLSIGSAGITTLAFSFLGDNAVLTREQKTTLLLPLAVASLILIGLLVLASPKRTVSEVEAQ